MASRFIDRIHLNLDRFAKEHLMSRLNVVTYAVANDDQKALLDAIQAKFGMVPNILGKASQVEIDFPTVELNQAA